MRVFFQEWDVRGRMNPEFSLSISEEALQVVKAGYDEDSDYFPQGEVTPITLPDEHVFCEMLESGRETIFLISEEMDVVWQALYGEAEGDE